ncbi:MAG: TlpA family protein disulfide reductase [Balneolaceae bacterium]
MSRTKNDKKRPNYKRTAIEWGVIGLILALLYFSGLHTPVIGTLQRAMLWTGFFDADTSRIATTDGAFLSENDFNFMMENEEGEETTLEDFRGEVVFVNVWASWCPPCVAEMPTIKKLHENVGGGDSEGVRFILLSMDQERQKAIEFMENKDMDIPYYFPASPLPAVFQNEYLPSTYVISKEGQIVYEKEGIADYSSQNFALWMLELTEK